MNTDTRQRLAGMLLSAMIALSIGSALLTPQLLIPGALAGWFAALLLLPDLTRVQRVQSGLMFLIGALLLLWFRNDGLSQTHLMTALSANEQLLAMLAAVSFLRLIATPRVEKHEQLPSGAGALWRTLFGVHFFGAVINMSVLVMVGDRLSRHQALSSLQAMILSRGFGTAALWSPFFASMGIALINAPGSELATVASVGLPIAIIALAFTAWHSSRQSQQNSDTAFRGYPMHFESLWIPALLALIVLVAHTQIEGVSILTLIALFSVMLTVVVLLWREPQSALSHLKSHITHNVTRMSGELVLFLAAGVLAAGILAASAGSELHVPFTEFTAFNASLLLILMVVLALFGIHPIIVIITSSVLLTPVVQDPNLLALTYVLGWSAGVIISPLSGMNLSLQGRYGIGALQFIRCNGLFVLFLMLIGIVALHLFSNLRGFF